MNWRLRGRWRGGGFRWYSNPLTPALSPGEREKDGCRFMRKPIFASPARLIRTRTLPEGPFGDHLGYYSLAHDFPVLKVDRVYHRSGAIWPFTVVGRPPQEDTVFGQLIHEITGPIIPTVVPGVRAVHAVDAAGVHPLLLAIGSERYTPYADSTRPQELLTQANAILGQGQLSLAKYLLIVNGDDDPALEISNIEAFLAHLLRRVDWRRDLHFQTCTTIDTLDYSSGTLNEGSKVVIAAAGPVRRELATTLPSELPLLDGFHNPRVCLPGVVAISGPPVAASLRDSDARLGETRPPREFLVRATIHGSDRSISTHRPGRRQRLHRTISQQFSLGYVYPQQSGGRH